MGLKEDANVILNNAYEAALAYPNSFCNHQDFIDFVIDNHHLTYKYVLFTALLSKATDERINPLCLQKKSTLPGAYDARTVCHKVIVPFEKETLEKALGGSNEPFLNKPARFPELDKTNAVRTGNDRAILEALCDNLPLIITASDAYQDLIYLLCKLIRIRSANESRLDFSINDSVNTPTRLMQYINEALKISYEGEILTLMVAGVYHLKYLNNPDAIVEVHPVNQSGASGREVSDLDIYIGQQLVSSNELKDKIYAITDVRHAADKVITAGGTSMLFIEGPHGEQDGQFADILQEEYASRNFMLRILSYQIFLSVEVPLLENINCEEFIKFILKTAHETKFKEEVITYLEGLAINTLGLSRT